MKMMRLQSIPIKIKRSNLPQLRKLSSKSLKDNDVVVCSFVRTPILKVGGAFSGLSAPKLMYVNPNFDLAEIISKNIGHKLLSKL